MAPMTGSSSSSSSSSSSNDSVYVSVLCLERGGQVCPDCVGLPDHLGCGWCSDSQMCTKRDKCPSGTWLASGDTCPYETAMGMLYFIALIVSVVMIVILIGVIVMLSDNVAKMWRKSRTLKQTDDKVDVNGKPVPVPPPRSTSTERTKDIITPESSGSSGVSKECAKVGQKANEAITSPSSSSTPSDLVSSSSTSSSSLLLRKNRAIRASVNGLQTPEAIYSIIDRSRRESQSLSFILGESQAEQSADMMSTSITSMTSSSSASVATVRCALRNDDDEDEKSIESGEYQYLAEAPFSCQTSIVPMTRNQFYLVLQINMNAGPARVLESSNRAKTDSRSNNSLCENKTDKDNDEDNAEE